MILSGVWVFNTTFEYAGSSLTQKVNITVNDIVYTDFVLLAGNSFYLFSSSGDRVLFAEKASDSDIYTVEENYKTWDFGDGQEVSDAFYIFVTSYARSQNGYVITYVTNCDAVIASVESNVMALPDPVCEGATFVGWSDSADPFEFEPGKIVAGTPLTSDVTLYAFWQLNAPKATITGNTLSWNEIPYAARYQVLVNGKIRDETEETSVELDSSFDGYTLSVIAWSDSNYFLDSEASNGIDFTYSSSGTQYTITYETNGGNAITSTTGTALPNPLPTPTRRDATFSEWYLDDTYSEQADPGQVITQDTTLYALYVLNEPVLRIDGNTLKWTIPYGADYFSIFKDNNLLSYTDFYEYTLSPSDIGSTFYVRALTDVPYLSGSGDSNRVTYSLSSKVLRPATVQMIKDLMSGKLPISGSSGSDGTDGKDGQDGKDGAPVYLINSTLELSEGQQEYDLTLSDFTPASPAPITGNIGITKAGILCSITEKYENGQLTGYYITCIKNLNGMDGKDGEDGENGRPIYYHETNESYIEVGSTTYWATIAEIKPSTPTIEVGDMAIILDRPGDTSDDPIAYLYFATVDKIVGDNVYFNIKIQLNSVENVADGQSNLYTHIIDVASNKFLLYIVDTYSESYTIETLYEKYPNVKFPCSGSSYTTTQIAIPRYIYAEYKEDAANQYRMNVECDWYEVVDGVLTHIDTRSYISTSAIGDTVIPITLNGGSAESQINMTATTATIEPNKTYVWGEVTALNITLAPPTDTSIVNEYHFFFDSGETATELTLPSTVLWSETPQIISNTTYEVIIENNCGKIIPYYENNDEVEIANVTLTGEEETPYFEVTGIDYASVRVVVLVPAMDSAQRMLITCMPSDNYVGYCGVTSTGNTTRFYQFFDSSNFYYPVHARSVGGGTWVTEYNMIFNIVWPVPNRINYIKIGLADTFSVQLPQGTIIKIYGKKY